MLMQVFNFNVMFYLAVSQVPRMVHVGFSPHQNFGQKHFQVQH